MQHQTCSLCGEEREIDKLVILTVPSSQGRNVREGRASFCHQCISSSLRSFRNPPSSTETVGSFGCSLCGRSAAEVELLLAGQKGSICKECLVTLNLILSDLQQD